MAEIHREEATIDADGSVACPEHTWWHCECGSKVLRFRGESDVRCGDCGNWYNAFGQRLRDDWQKNRSNWDDDVSDLDGYEEAYAGDE